MELENCKSLNDICRELYGKANYTNREKVKIILLNEGIDWKEWLNSKKQNAKKYCLCCGKELVGEQQKFCSSSCSATFNNKQRKKISIELPQTEDTKEPRYCLCCGKELKKAQDKFCSVHCKHYMDYIEVIKKWKEGLFDGKRGEYGISNYIRRYLFEKNNCKCELCGWGEENTYTNKVPLEVHHKDGDYTNNKEENLQLLCPNCHSLTETFKSHNKNGRKSRDKYK